MRSSLQALVVRAGLLLGIPLVVGCGAAKPMARPQTQIAVAPTVQPLPSSKPALSSEDWECFEAAVLPVPAIQPFCDNPELRLGRLLEETKKILGPEARSGDGLNALIVALRYYRQCRSGIEPPTRDDLIGLYNYLVLDLENGRGRDPAHCRPWLVMLRLNQPPEYDAF